MMQELWRLYWYSVKYGLICGTAEPVLLWQKVRVINLDSGSLDAALGPLFRSFTVDISVHDAGILKERGSGRAVVHEPLELDAVS
ncbi:hypothetical protein [Sphingomonas sp. 22176]|uniref:hypothetical protein n=1 Tax=Sphingomonas sp. 22176 TaxID=3453884 RepID=UPI003F87532A